MMHLLFLVGLALPFAGGVVFYKELNMGSLSLFIIRPLGVLLFFGGVYLGWISHRSLIKTGRGAAAFLLTKKLVDVDIYQKTRNPMSLSWYLLCLGAGLILESLFLTLYALLVQFPFHVLYLKYFEEKELEIRLGQEYERYKRKVPFLIPKRGD